LDDLHQEAEASRRALIGSARGHGGRRRAGAARWHSCHSCWFGRSAGRLTAAVCLA